MCRLAAGLSLTVIRRLNSWRPSLNPQPSFGLLTLHTSPHGPGRIHKKGAAPAAPAILSMDISGCIVPEYSFDLEEFLEAVLTPFAAGSRLLVTTEGRIEIGTSAIQMHIARAQA